MNSEFNSGSGMSVERYELKFTIPDYLVEPISDFVSIYCSLDKHSANSRDGYYRVNNLYFDTPNFLFLKRRLDGSDNRFNMRVRSYRDDAAAPCFFEIKQKQVNIIRKYRARINDDKWAQMFETPGCDPGGSERCLVNSNKGLFLKLAYSYDAAPKVLTQYRRKAYVSDIDDYARVTFDTDLRYQPNQGYSLLPQEAGMIPSDNSTLFDPGCSVILELKCFTVKVPFWMIDLIKSFDLHRRSFSKYVTGVREVLNIFQFDAAVRNSRMTMNI